MAMYTVDVVDHGVARDIDATLFKLANLKPAYEIIAQYLRTIVSDSFKQE